MLLGKRPRHPIKRTTSMTGIEVELEQPSSGGDHIAGHQPPFSTAVVHDNSTTVNYTALISPRNSRSVQSHAHDHFLRTCRLCKLCLAPGRDIFMYRGDTAFCSSECREKQIKEDEKTEYEGKKRDERLPVAVAAAAERSSKKKEPHGGSR